jgi:hypothetical protein
MISSDAKIRSERAAAPERPTGQFTRTVPPPLSQYRNDSCRHQEVPPISNVVVFQISMPTRPPPRQILPDKVLSQRVLVAVLPHQLG